MFRPQVRQIPLKLLQLTLHEPRMLHVTLEAKMSKVCQGCIFIFYKGKGRETTAKQTTSRENVVHS